jgi:hypothetical protein
MGQKRLTILASLVMAIVAIPLAASAAAAGGPPTTNNGWFDGHQIYYLDKGVEKKAHRANVADIFLIGGNRTYQANVVDSVPGVKGYSPHWDVNVVHTAEGVELGDILDSPYASASYPEALFDSVPDILAAWEAGLITIEEPGVLVLCPIVNVKAADAPGHTAASEDFDPFPADGF